MFNKKNILSVILTVSISALLVGAVVSATSLIGDDITVGDDLTVTSDLAVTSTSTLTGALLVDTNVLYADNNENKVGVNTTSTSDIFAVATSSAAKPSFVVTTSGKIGLASSSPLTAVGVVGTSTLQTVLPDADATYALGSSAWRWKTFDVSATTTIGGPLLVDTNVLYVDSNENKVGVNTTSTANVFAVATSSTDNPSFLVTTAGRVGIASSTPGTALVVAGTSTLQNVIIGDGGTFISKHLSTSTSIDLPSIVATTCATSVVSVGLAGVAAGDVVIASPTPTASLIEAFPLVWSALASTTANYVCLTICNVSRNDYNVDAQTWRFDVWKH